MPRGISKTPEETKRKKSLLLKGNTRGFKKGVYQGFGFKKGSKINLGRIRTKEEKEKNRLSHLGKKMPLTKWEKHWRWMGDNAGYGGIHDWVRRWKGTPNTCEHCGRSGLKRYEWANIDHQYNRILDDYIRLCVSCHQKFDYKFNNKRTKK